MAGGPYKGGNGGYYIIWSDKRAYPNRPKVREQLKTKKSPQANKRKHRLEELYQIGKHNPWESRWYDNHTIRPFIAGSLLKESTSVIQSPGEYITLGDAAEKYIAYQLSRPKGWNSETTRKLYPKEIRYFITRIGPRVSLSHITATDVHQALYRDGATSDETIQGNRSKLMAFFNYCKKQGWIKRVPEIEAPEPQKKVPKFFYDIQFLQCCWHKLCDVETQLKINRSVTPDEVENTRQQLRYVLAWMLMAGTGMRPNEAAGIRLQDVYDNQLLVAATHRGKTNAQRMVPILYEAKSAVSVLTCPKYRSLDIALRDSDRLLGIESQRSKERVSTELRLSWAAVVGKGKRTAYNLRDYFAVRYLADADQGIPDFRLLQLRNILGHSTITTTEKYLKAVPSRLNLKIGQSEDLVKILSDISARVTT